MRSTYANAFKLSIPASILLIVVLSTTGCETQTNITPIEHPAPIMGLNSPTTDLSVSESSRYVITWTSGFCSNFNCSVYARVYNQSAAPLTDEILVSPINGFYSDAEAAIDDLGNFVVVYERYLHNPANPEQSNHIYLNRYAPDGTLVGTPQFVGYGISPEIAMTPKGQFNISYATYTYSNGGEVVYVNRYNANGVQVGAPITVDSAPDIGSTRLRMLCTGDFIVVYDAGILAGHTSYARRYFANGTPRGNRITLNQSAFINLTEGLIYNSNGSFAFLTQQNPPPLLTNYFLSRYDANGNPATPELLWDSATNVTPAIANNACGQYALIYKDIRSDSIMATEYSADDVPGEPYLVSESTPNQNPHIGLSSDFFVAAWDRRAGSGTYNSIHRRVFLSTALNQIFQQGASARVCYFGCSDGCQSRAVIGPPPIPGYSYSWSPATNLSNSHIAQPTVTHPFSATPFSIAYTLTIGAPCCQRKEIVVVSFEYGCL